MPLLPSQIFIWQCLNYSAAMLLGAVCLEISMNFMQAHRNNDVKLAGSPRRSKTSECKVEMKIGVVTPSRAAISSSVAQNAFSRRIDVLCPFKRSRLVVLEYRSGSCPANTSHMFSSQSSCNTDFVFRIRNEKGSPEFPPNRPKAAIQGAR